METWLFFLGWVLLGLASILKAISPIATTAIAERHKTERARINSPRNEKAANAPVSTTNATSLASDSTRSQAADRFTGLLASLAASGQIASLYFGPDKDSPLTVGVAAFIAQALVMYAIGWFLLNRRA